MFKLFPVFLGGKGVGDFLNVYSQNGLLSETEKIIKIASPSLLPSEKLYVLIKIFSELNIYLHNI